MQEFANDVKDVVREYYGDALVWNSEEMVTVASTSATTLQDSTLTAPWAAICDSYNCYGYAMEQLVRRNPGYFSGNEMTEMMTIGDIGELVEADLYALGHTQVQRTFDLSEAEDLCKNEKAICLRISEGIDYHFMRLYDGNWYHKPGQTAVLKYNYWITNIRLWTNESIYDGVYYPGTITYDSSIMVITYDGGHEWEYSYCGTSNGVNMHIYSCNNCTATSGSPSVCLYKGSTICSLCGTSKDANAISLEVAP